MAVPLVCFPSLWGGESHHAPACWQGRWQHWPLALSACGQDRQDENEAEGTYKVDVVSASFPGRQHLADEATLRIEIQNKDSREIPNLAVTVDGFGQRRENVGARGPGAAGMDSERGTAQLEFCAHEHLDRRPGAGRTDAHPRTGR